MLQQEAEIFLKKMENAGAVSYICVCKPDGFQLFRVSGVIPIHFFL
jgi:hypothetical protein